MNWLVLFCKISKYKVYFEPRSIEKQIQNLRECKEDGKECERRCKDCEKIVQRNGTKSVEKKKLSSKSTHNPIC